MTTKLPEYQVLANEAFFTRILNLCMEGGTYVWPDELVLFTVKKGLLYGNPEALSCAKCIVSESFFIKTFRLEPTN